MSRLDRNRIIENQVQEFFPEIQKFEFENEDIFATWLGAQKDQYGWTRHDVPKVKGNSRVNKVICASSISHLVKPYSGTLRKLFESKSRVVTGISVSF